MVITAFWKGNLMTGYLQYLMILLHGLIPDVPLTRSSLWFRVQSLLLLLLYAVMRHERSSCWKMVGLHTLRKEDRVEREVDWNNFLWINNRDHIIFFVTMAVYKQLICDVPWLKLLLDQRLKFKGKFCSKNQSYLITFVPIRIENKKS